MSVYPDGMNTSDPRCPEHRVTESEIEERRTENECERNTEESNVDEIYGSLNELRLALQQAAKNTRSDKCKNLANKTHDDICKAFEGFDDAYRDAFNDYYDTKDAEIQRGELS